MAGHVRAQFADGDLGRVFPRMGVTHIFDSHADLAQASTQWIDLFLDRHVVNPHTYPSTEPPGQRTGRSPSALRRWRGRPHRLAAYSAWPGCGWTWRCQLLVRQTRHYLDDPRVLRARTRAPRGTRTCGTLALHGASRRCARVCRASCATGSGGQHAGRCLRLN
jgi:hypothetical protein